MPAKVVFFEKLLVVIRHTDEVELGKAESGMNACWVHISVDQPLVMNVDKGLAELPKYAEHLVCSKLLLAVRLPSGKVIWGLSIKQQGSIIIEELKIRRNTEYVRMLQLRELPCYLNGLSPFLLIKSRYVYTCY